MTIKSTIFRFLKNIKLEMKDKDENKERLNSILRLRLFFSTEKELRKAVGSIKKDKIIFFVSQRAGTIQAADRIIVMESGSVAGIGTHDELLKTNEVYQEIYKSQVDAGEVAS